MLLTMIVVLSIATAALAAPTKTGLGKAHVNTGCGLGTLLWKHNADESILSQSLQATTNGTSGNQTFGITTGTLECDQPVKVAANDRLNEFVLANMDSLAKDIARGEGETLEAFAELMGVPAVERPQFYAKLQDSFASIFTNEKVTMASVVDNSAAVR
jgi:hypothetical protein